MQDLPPDHAGRVEQLYGQSFGLLAGYLNRILKDVESARDCAQAAFLRLARQDSAQIASPKAWLFRVGRNLALEQIRRTKFRNDDVEADAIDWADESAVSPVDTVTASDSAMLLRQLVRRLPARQREVLELRYFAQIHFSEIGAICGDDTNNIYQLHYAGLRKLRSMMEADAQGSELLREGTPGAKVKRGREDSFFKPGLFAPPPEPSPDSDLMLVALCIDNEKYDEIAKPHESEEGNELLKGLHMKLLRGGFARGSIGLSERMVEPRDDFLQQLSAQVGFFQKAPKKN